MAPKILATIAAIAVAKHENRDADERRRLAAAEAERLRAEEERRAALERKRATALDTFIAEQSQITQLENYLNVLEHSV